jgi:hypothetical protein
MFDVRTLKTTAMEAGKGKIIGCGTVQMLSSNDVINLERNTVMRMRYSTVLTTIAGALPNLLNQELGFSFTLVARGWAPLPRAST